jgi:hypothetical protein
MCVASTGLPDFPWSKHPKWGKIPNDYRLFQMALKDKKWLQTVSNGHKIYQNIPTFYILRPSKIYPNWDFWARK